MLAGDTGPSCEASQSDCTLADQCSIRAALGEDGPGTRLLTCQRITQKHMEYQHPSRTQGEKLVPRRVCHTIEKYF